MSSCSSQRFSLVALESADRHRPTSPRTWGGADPLSHPGGISTEELWETAFHRLAPVQQPRSWLRLSPKPFTKKAMGEKHNNDEN